VRPGGSIALAAALLLAAAAATAEGVGVESGAAFSLGTGTLDLGCTDLAVAGSFAGGSGLVEAARDVSIQPGGSLDAGSASLRVTGDWSNAGSFSAGSGAVAFVDGCGRAGGTLSGNSTFFDLEMTTQSGKAYAFEAGSTQKVQGALALAGEDGNRLVIRSTLAGSAAYLAALGSQSVAFVDVEDNYAIANPILYGPDSIVGVNTNGWTFFLGLVPALGPAKLALLAALLLTASTLALRRRPRAA